MVAPQGRQAPLRFAQAIAMWRRPICQKQKAGGDICTGASMVDILLIQPPIADYYLTAKRTIPYGLACIAGALLQRGYRVAILDALASRKSRVIDPPVGVDDLGMFYGRSDRSP